MNRPSRLGRWTLQELGVDFEAITINLVAGENRMPEFLALNPAGRYLCVLKFIRALKQRHAMYSDREVLSVLKIRPR